jgi:hypothetical protein
VIDHQRADNIHDAQGEIEMNSIRFVLTASLIGAGLGLHMIAQAAGAGIAGNYHIHGQNPDGRPYEGALRIEQKGEVYALTWDSGGTTHGVGVLQDGHLVVGYGDSACGVVAYKKQSAGVLDGIWAMANSTQLGSEMATPAQGTGAPVSGDYLVTGHNVDRTDYKGALFIKSESDDSKLSLLWRTGPDARGFGFQAGNIVAATFGPSTCGVVAYAVPSDGRLSGQWTMLHGGLGSEEASKVD